MSWFQTFPGTSGFYASREDTNLLDADSSHIHQSKGQWTVTSNQVAAVQQASPNGLSPTFGDFSLQCETSGIASLSYIQQATEAFPVAASTAYTLSYDMMTAIARNTNVSVAYFDAGGGSTGSDFNSAEAITVDAWGRHSFEFTTPALTVSASVSIRYRTASGNFASGEQCWIDSVCVRAGSDGTFVPSVRIVGDLDIRTKLSMTDWTQSTRRTFLDIGYDSGATDGWKLVMESTDQLAFQGYGATGLINELTSAFTLVDGQSTDIRFTADVSAGVGEWYQDSVGVETEAFTAQVLVPSGDPFRVGANAVGGDLFIGDVYWAEVRDGIDGPVVAGWYGYDAWTAAQ